MRVFYSNGTAYSVILEDIPSDNRVTRETLIQAGELKITYTFSVNFETSVYIFIHSTILLPLSSCNYTSKIYDILKGSEYWKY